ncbi:MAG TPA: ABC transporter substrate-binding protein [Candidatus Binatia bacterium]|nr:ABC transporter substrate-binding protein [Candidatus Binatia bacterium]
MKVPRIGYLSAGFSSPKPARTEAFRQGLRDLGYVEGQNILIEYRYAEGKLGRLPGLAAELLRLNVDMVFAYSTPAVRVLKEATTIVPVVTVSADPVRNGFVASLARPGGNITGLANLTPELAGKRLELLKEVVPKISRVAVIWNSNDPGSELRMRETETAARSWGIKVQSVEVRESNDLERAFSAIKIEQAGALVPLRGRTTNNLRERIIELAKRDRVPAVYDDSPLVEAGGLMSYGTEIAELDRRAASYVDKILKGAKPANLPIEQPTKFELWMNLKTAKQIGLTIPPNVLARADRVIR